jgi:predicted molibdopterin-dependent oxidoreductase YjgC
MYVMGENPLSSLPEPDFVLTALKSLECLIVQDIVLSKTARIADVVLPAAAFSEKAGSFTNMEGKIQCFLPAALPPGNAKPDLDILGMVADRIGASNQNRDIEQIRKEISRVITCYSDGSAFKHPIWIREETHPEEKLAEQQIRFSPAASTRGSETDPRYPYVAMFSSSRFHLGSGTRTGLSARVASFGGQGKIEISPADAGKLKLADNDTIKVVSATGEIERNVMINPAVVTGYIHIPKAFNGNDARRLLKLQPLLEAGCGGWISCPVAIEMAETYTMQRQEGRGDEYD